MSLLGNLGYSAVVTLLGLFIVFLGLIILIGCIKLMSKVTARIRENAEAAKQAAKPAPAPVIVPEPVAEAAAEKTGMDQDELIAVITAAILAAAKPEKGKKLVVRNVRRTSAWAAAGRAEQISRF